MPLRGLVLGGRGRVDFDERAILKEERACPHRSGTWPWAASRSDRSTRQSLPLSRLAGRIYRAAPQTGGGRKGEGSILDVGGGLGNMIDGR